MRMFSTMLGKNEILFAKLGANFSESTRSYEEPETKEGKNSHGSTEKAGAFYSNNNLIR